MLTEGVQYWDATYTLTWPPHMVRQSDLPFIDRSSIPHRLRQRFWLTPEGSADLQSEWLIWKWASIGIRTATQAGLYVTSQPFQPAAAVPSTVITTLSNLPQFEGVINLLDLYQLDPFGDWLRRLELLYNMAPLHDLQPWPCMQHLCRDGPKIATNLQSITDFITDLWPSMQRWSKNCNKPSKHDWLLNDFCGGASILEFWLWVIVPLIAGFS